MARSFGLAGDDGLHDDQIVVHLPGLADQACCAFAENGFATAPQIPHRIGRISARSFSSCFLMGLGLGVAVSLQRIDNAR